MIQRAEQLHRQFFQPGLDAPAVANWEPPIDVFENDNTLTIVVALPGVEPSDITIALDSDLLQITGIRRLAAARGTAIRRLEIPHGRFERRIRLPDARWRIDGSVIENGCLALRLTRAANSTFAR